MNDKVFSELNEMQARARAELIWGLSLFAVTGIVAIFFGFFALIPFVPCVILFAFSFRDARKMTQKYKTQVVGTVLSEMIDEVRFAPELGIPQTVIRETGMMRLGNRYHANDLITGFYHGVSFAQSDVCIQEETRDEKGNTSVETIFRGRWMTFDFNKPFRCDLQIASKRFGAFQKKSTLFTGEKKFSRVKFENEQFNRDFYVTSQDETEAFYVITPQWMEKLIGLQTSLRAPFMLMFSGGTFHVAVANNKDAFELGVFRKIDAEGERERILSDLRVITDFVDDLSLDRRIYQ